MKIRVRSQFPTLARVAVISLVSLTACGGGDSESSIAAEAPTDSIAADAAYSVNPGTHMITVTDAEPGTTLVVLAADGTQVARGEVDELGSLLFRRVDVGTYRVTTEDQSQSSGPIEVYGPDAVPAPDFYSSQVLPAGGFGYLTTRDGTTLSINVSLPGPVEDGPYPTVLEYSGYAPSNPGDSALSLLYNALGFAYVGVNMRGTGCSGGSYRFFEEAQLLDGYDAIEAVAAQPWVEFNEVGMVGISYPGISQLFVASTQPPSLSAITPLSVLDDSYRSTLYPGGILNTGFAVEWTSQRVREAAPFGQEWTKKRADEGDTVCADNQNLRLQNPDLEAEIDANPYYSAELGDEINPSKFVGSIDVPVFVAGAWQDEQTGGHFPALLDDFTSTDDLYVTLLNGLHTESIGPAVLPRYVEFLSLYVAKKVPDLTAAIAAAPTLAGAIYGVPTPIVAPNRFAGLDYASALETFSSEPRIQVLFEEGAADGQPAAAPLNRWSAGFDAWPIASTVATRWQLGDAGRFGPSITSTGGTEYTADPTAVPGTFYSGDGSGIWRADVKFDWVRNPQGTAAVFTSDPLTDDVVLIGSASADLWISADATDTDLEVTISEIRPDGNEVYVQSGWLRASQRALDDSSTELRVVQTHLESDVEPLVPGEPVLARVDIFPFAHAFRAGSQLRITIDAPGGNRGVWSFRSISAGEKVTVLHDAEHPSSIVLPVIPGVSVPAGLPACGSLRGQPCRPV